MKFSNSDPSLICTLLSLYGHWVYVDGTAALDTVMKCLQLLINNMCRNLKLDYLDLYLIHWPASAKPGAHVSPIPPGQLMPMDFKGVWRAMEKCQQLGLTKSIGVSNFSCKKLDHILSFATIPPSANQVRLLWKVISMSFDFVPRVQVMDN